MNESEKQFFDKIAATWDENEIVSTPERINAMMDLLDVKPGMNILDVGTGTGILIPFFYNRIGDGGSVTAVDGSEGMLKRAVEKYGSLRVVRFLKADIEEHSVDGCFDLIMLFCVYPHLNCPVQTLSRLVENNLSPGGRLFIAFPTDEDFVNDIHRETKAPNRLLPPAGILVDGLGEGGLKATVVSTTHPYLVMIEPTA